MQAADYTILSDYNTKLNYFFRGNLEKNWRDPGFCVHPDSGRGNWELGIRN